MRFLRLLAVLTAFTLCLATPAEASAKPHVGFTFKTSGITVGSSAWFRYGSARLPAHTVLYLERFRGGRWGHVRKLRGHSGTGAISAAKVGKFRYRIEAVRKSRSVAVSAIRTLTVKRKAMPSVYRGRWSGKIDQTGVNPYTAELSLVSGRIGDRVGTSHYPELNCSGYLTLRTVTAKKIVVSETITDNRARCFDDDLNLAYQADDTIDYSFTMGSYVGVGSLARD